jgi:DNA (cytosine-5)-methyltransferase 1
LCARQNDGFLPPFPIWDDVQTFDGKPWRGIAQVVSGGFPCQDISVAGGGDGLDGERSGMWREMARIIGEVQPQYAFVENSPMLTSRGLGTVLGDLAEMGFDAKWCVLGADSVGAPHKRDRIWILATNARGIGRNIWRSHREERSVLQNINRDASQDQSKRKRWISGFRETGSNVANSNSNIERKISNTASIGSHNEKNKCIMESEGRCEFYFEQSRDTGKMANTSSIRSQGQREYEQSINSEKKRKWKTIEPIYGCSPDFWSIEPNVGRVVNGLADRVDRLKAIGNGQVPLCAATAWRILNEL